MFVQKPSPERRCRHEGFREARTWNLCTATAPSRERSRASTTLDRSQARSVVLLENFGSRMWAELGDVSGVCSGALRLTLGERILCALAQNEKSCSSFVTFVQIVRWSSGWGLARDPCLAPPRAPRLLPHDSAIPLRDEAENGVAWFIEGRCDEDRLKSVRGSNRFQLVLPRASKISSSASWSPCSTTPQG